MTRRVFEAIGRRRVWLALAPAGFVLALATPGTADAQYFGRNKVQYEKFDFKVLRTDHFDIHYYPEEEAAVRDAARMAERWYSRLSGAFVHQIEDRIPLILYADKPDFQQTNTTFGFISEATGGFTEGLKDRIVMPFTETYGDTDHVIGHELVHAFQFDIGRGQRTEGPASIDVLPLWAIEGLAEYLSIGREDAHTAMWIRDALLRDSLPTVQQLSRDPRYFPYRWGQAFWAYVGGRWGDEVVTTLYRTAGRRGLGGAIRRNLGMSHDTLSARWQEALEAHYGPLIEGRTTPAQAGEFLLGSLEESFALAPTISPDGSRIVFLSDREFFTIELFVADLRTGEVLGSLAETDRNPHFDALAFTNTAGAWSPDSRRFAFVTFDEGNNEIAIADVDRRSVERSLDLPGIGAVSSLAWSPDGRWIAFSGQTGGVTDLYLVDVTTGELERLTDDRWAELHPEFSPDGGTIAFATDRDGDLDSLDFSALAIGLLDRDSREVRVMRPFGGAKHINPRYAPDGRSLYFISDREGFSDVYRLDLESGDTYQVTRLATGVSGITASAPALSVARATGRLAFSVFHGGEWYGVALDAERARGDAVPSGEVPALAAVLPPTEQAPRVIVSRYLADPAAGLPPVREYAARDYRRGLRLDFIAPPAAGVASDQFGTSLGGSIGFFMSDMLGDQQLVAAVASGGGFKDLGGEVLYRDIGDRLNWGVQGGRIPQRIGFTRFAQGEIGGQPVNTIDLVLQRIFYDRASVLLDYPFSMTRRIEAEAGYTRISFDIEVTRAFIIGNTIVARERFEPEAPEALDLFQGSLAFVEDYSFFGFTSPVRGGRSRFELAGNFGSLDFATALLDWRRYMFMRPVTLAIQGLHFGRYGPDAENNRLSPLFLGISTLVRGYESGTFEPEECSFDPEEPLRCPEFDRLIGSKVGIGKVELRLPLFGTEQFGLIETGFLPVELAFFVDGGVAWTDDESPKLSFDSESLDRIPVFSAGVSTRLNFMGAFVAEIYWAYPFQRPDDGGHVGFQIVPGW